MRRYIRFTQLAAVGLIAGAWFGLLPTAEAQFGGTSTTSSFGQRSLGGGTSSNRTGRSAGASGTSNSLGGVGGAGSGLGGGMTGTGTAPTGGERFVRGNRQGAFVGADSSEAINPYSQQAAGGAGALGGMGGLGGGMGNQMMMQAFRQNTQQNQTGRNQQQNGRTQLRPSFTVGFETAPVTATTFTSRQQLRYANLPALKGKGRIELVMEGDILVLRGQVESAADRQLAEDLLSLEPEVSRVRNELEIAQQASSLPELTPPARSPAAGSSGTESVPTTVSRPLER